MALHAIRDAEDAVAVTRDFLTPPELGRWVRLAVIVAFVGGGLSVPTTGADPGNVVDTYPGPAPPPEVPAAVFLAVAVIIGVVLLFVLALGLIAAVMEFVLVESLRSGEVTVRRYWRARWRQGVRLFAFRLVLGLPVLVLVLVLVALFLYPLLAGVEGTAGSLAVLAVGLPLVVLATFAVGIVGGLTTVFVVPIMVLTDGGVLASWRRLWSSLAAEPKQYLAYVGIGVVLTLSGGLVLVIAVVVVTIVLAIPFAIVGVAAASVLTVDSLAGIAVLATLGAVFVGTLLTVATFLKVPLVVYLRYYALLVLGDIEPTFDLIPDRRAELRG